MNTQHTGGFTRITHSDHFRLQHLNNKIATLLLKLNSYRCEPCTSDLHQRHHELKKRGVELRKSAERALQSIQGAVPHTKELKKEIKDFLADCGQYQSQVLAYFAGISARGHYSI